MKTTQPNDYSKTPEEYLIESHMGKSKQVASFAKFVLFCFGIWLAVWGATGLWERLAAEVTK